MESISVLICVLSSLELIIYLITAIAIQKNKTNIFLSIRSTNVLQVINANIFLSICVFFTTIFNITESGVLSEILSIFQSLFVVFHIITFFSFIITIHRIKCCSTIDIREDDLLTFKYFKSHSYHYEYFYIRLILFVTAALLFALLIAYFSLKEFELFPFAKINNPHLYPIKIFWLVLFSIETAALITYQFFMFSNEIRAKIKTQILLAVILNILYSVTANILLFYIKNIDNSYLNCMSIIYLLLLQFTFIGLPLFLSRFDKTTTAYNITSEALNDLYLLLSNEQSYNKFEEYLMLDQNRKENRYFLDMYTHIIKYRVLFMIEEINLYKLNEARTIHNLYFKDKLLSQYANEDSILQNLKKQNAGLIHRSECTIDMFDPALEKAYSYLFQQFLSFKRSEEFSSLVSEVNYDTYLRCKLADCGLIKK